MRYLALCCIARNEDPFLREWVAYHALLGVEHFYIYDNMSDVPVGNVLKGYADPARVTVRRIHGKAVQMEAYQDCLASHGAKYRWMGFIDLDEFVLPMRDTDLRVMLSEFEEYAALGLTWRIFSSNGHEARPKGGQIRNYTRAFPADSHPRNAHIKSFIHPARIAAARNPHFFWYKPGGYAVTDEHLPIPAELAYAPSLQRTGRINHYYYRSRQDFKEKIARGRGTVADPALANKMEYFEEHLNFPVEEDHAIQRFWPVLNTVLKTDALPPLPDIPEDAPFPVYCDAAMLRAGEGDMTAAAVILCHAAIRHSTLPELWTLRAMLERGSGRLDRAERFIRHALTLGMDPRMYMELATIRSAAGDREGAAAICRFLRFLLTVRKDLDGEWLDTLEKLEREAETGSSPVA